VLTSRPSVVRFLPPSTSSASPHARIVTRTPAPATMMVVCTAPTGTASSVAKRPAPKACGAAHVGFVVPPTRKLAAAEMTTVARDALKTTTGPPWVP
jgi:hypothetical protein